MHLEMFNKLNEVNTFMINFFNLSKKLLISLLLIFLLTACSNTNTKNDSAKSYSNELNSEQSEMSDRTDTVIQKEKKQTTNQLPETNRKLIKRAEIQMETKKFKTTISALEKSVNRSGGYIESNHVSGTSIEEKYDEDQANYVPSRNASYTLRIPSTKLNSFLDDLNIIGNIVSKTISSEDISTQYFDTETRVKSLKIQEERLLDLLKKSGSLKDIIELEKELTDVRYEIESLTTTLKTYDSLVNYSTVNLSISEVATITDTTPPKKVSDRIAAKFKQNINSISEGLKNTTVFLIGNSLIIIFWLLIVTVGYFIIRKVMKKYQDLNIPK